MSLLEALGVGGRGLTAAQLAMNVANQNISNADTEGYSRKRLNLASDYKQDQTYGQMGFGVDVQSISRMRDSFIDKQINQQTQNLGYYEEIDGILEHIENVFSEPNEVGLNKLMENFWNAWHDLSNNPSDISARSMVKASGQSLIDTFHSLSDELQTLSVDKSEKFYNIVEQINNYLKDISNLNHEISTIELDSRRIANDSRDRRDLALRKLSKLIDIDVVQEQNGAVTVLTSGNVVVSKSEYVSLEVYTNTLNMANSNPETQLSIRFSNNKRPCEPRGGQLGGIFYARDTILPAYVRKLDGLASAMVNEVNTIHESGYSLDGNTGISFFTPPAADPLNPSAVIPVTAQSIALSTAVQINIANIAAAAGANWTPRASNFQVGGIPEPLPAGALNLGVFYFLNKSGREVVARDSVVITDVTGGNRILQQGTDYTIDYENGRFAVLNPALIAAGAEHELNIRYQGADSGTNGIGDNTNALAIAMLRQKNVLQPGPTGNMTATFNVYYTSFIGTLGADKTESSGDVSTRKFLLEQMDNRQAEIAGVSLDEEMANLIKYQNSFQASARMISAVDNMLDVLMNM